MSLSYYLGRQDTRGLFDLGSAHELAAEWYGLAKADDLTIQLPPETSLAALLRQHLPLHDADAHYYQELARRLVAFAGEHPVELLNEEDDEQLDNYRDEQGALRIVDSRYSAEWHAEPAVAAPE